LFTSRNANPFVPLTFIRVPKNKHNRTANTIIIITYCLPSYDYLLGSNAKPKLLNQTVIISRLIIHVSVLTIVDEYDYLLVFLQLCTKNPNPYSTCLINLSGNNDIFSFQITRIRRNRSKKC